VEISIDPNKTKDLNTRILLIAGYCLLEHKRGQADFGAFVESGH
jgi:hypothetical protein